MAGFSNPTNSPFRDHDGRYKTYSLFIEYPKDSCTPFFTLKDQDMIVNDVTYPSLKKLYFTYDHVPGYEYDFAMETLGSWDHWVKLVGSGLKSHFADWRTELEIRNKARALRAIIKTTKEGGAAGANAAKYIAEKGYAAKRGRPSKEEVERELVIAAGVDKELENDLERVGLRLAKR